MLCSIRFACEINQRRKPCEGVCHWTGPAQLLQTDRGLTKTMGKRPLDYEKRRGIAIRQSPARMWSRSSRWVCVRGSVKPLPPIQKGTSRDLHFSHNSINTPVKPPSVR